MSDLDPVVDHLAADGVEPSGGVIDTGYGPRCMLVACPDGNLVEFVEGVARPPRRQNGRSPNATALGRGRPL